MESPRSPSARVSQVLVSQDLGTTRPRASRQMRRSSSSSPSWRQRPCRVGDGGAWPGDGGRALLALGVGLSSGEDALARPIRGEGVLVPDRWPGLGGRGGAMSGVKRGGVVGGERPSSMESGE